MPGCTVNAGQQRDPIGKTITETFIEAHPDWSDQQIADRVNAEAGGQLLDVDEVAHWRAEVAW